MEAERFDELFQEESRWVGQARRLYIAGDALTDQVVAVDGAEARERMPNMSERIELLHSLAGARALLFGLAIENAAKAKQIQEGTVVSNGGNPVGLRTDHNILEHARQLGISLTEEEEEFLRLVTFQTKSLSKYPIAKNLTAQREFSGVMLGAVAEESDTVRSIIHKILGDNSMIDHFDQGNFPSA